MGVETKRCIVVPVHPPKTNWLLAMLQSFVASGGADSFTIAIVASTMGDGRFFRRLLTSLGYPLHIEYVCAESYMRDTLEFRKGVERFLRDDDNCIVNNKKFAGLHWASNNGYEWVASMDSDVIAVADLSDLFDVARANYEKNLYFGTATQIQNCPEIMQRCAAMFPADEQEHLQLEYTNRVVYPWFFDLPFYSGLDLDAFFKKMAETHGDLESWFCLHSWHMFEHLVFQMWRTVSRGSRLIDCSQIGINAIPELMSLDDLIRLKGKYEYCPVWVGTRLFVFDPDIARSLGNVRLAYHFDRI